jgi:DNA-binding GntR family transcriptional regulator
MQSSIDLGPDITKGLGAFPPRFLTMKTLSSNVYRVMRHRLLTGNLSPGERISEHALAKEFGVSRGPIREAIGKLAAERLLDQLPNSGTFVRTSTRKELEELYQLRAWLEGEATAEAADKITDAELLQLQQCCDQMAAIVDNQRETGAHIMADADNERFVMTDLKFHLTLVKACGNSHALKLLGDQHIVSRACSAALVPKQLAVGQQSHREHVEILDSLRARDGEQARQRVRQHILGAIAPLLAEFDRREAAQMSSNMFQTQSDGLEQVLREIESGGG